MKKYSTSLVLILGIFINLPSCQKTYEEGSNFSIRSKLNRITGKWKLVEMEGWDRLNPNVDQYMELTEERIGEGNNYYSGGRYKAMFTRFQQDYSLQDTILNEALFTTGGEWEFSGGDYGGCYAAGGWGEELDHFEGLFIYFNPLGDTNIFQDKCKIIKLTNRELKINQRRCNSPGLGGYHLYGYRTLTFKKV